LTAAGFAGAEAVMYDDEQPYHANATIIASPAIEPKINKNVSILSGSPSTSGPAAQAAISLEKQDFVVDFMSLTDGPRPGQDIISVLDLEGKAFLEGLSASQFRSLQSFLTELTSSGMLWLTRASQIECTEPQYAQIIGLARSVRNELSIDLATVELDDVQDQTAFDRVVDVLVKFQGRSRYLETDPEWEYAIRKGVVHVSRFRWISVWNELSSDTDPGAPKTLEIGKRGSLKTLRWVQRPQIQLTGDEVAVEVRAAGMNFKDLLISMGVVDGNMDDGNGLGCECAGLVTQVGPDANFQVGDRVAVLSGDAYSTVLRTSSALCARIPDDLSFEDAATMPCVYATVIHGLLDLARIEKGQTVLIHSGCGGVGIAAIHICRMVGASIFATVGTDDKVDYLVRTFDIPRSHIFNSRSSSFLPDVMRETDGRGVDVVLNSLSGELLHASWKCVAEFGSMVEIGKRDFIGQGRLAMEAFEANRTFYGVELSQIAEKRPSMVKKLLERAMEYVRLGAIQPIRPVKLFEAVDVEAAMRYMQKGQHMGKLVIRFPTDHSVLPASRGNNRLRLRPDASYLLVGGLGGLGRSVSTWMAEHGARHFVYLSRNGGKGPNDAAFVQEMEAAGCTVQVTAGSVASLADVQRAIQEAKYPIAGVLQMSMVLRVSCVSYCAASVSAVLTPLPPGRRVPQDDLRRVAGRQRRQSRRHLEPAPRLLVAAARLLCPLQLRVGRLRPGRPSQLRGSQHLPRRLRPVPAQPASPSLGTRHLHHGKRRLAGGGIRRPRPAPRHLAALPQGAGPAGRAGACHLQVFPSHSLPLPLPLPKQQQQRQQQQQLPQPLAASPRPANARPHHLPDQPLPLEARRAHGAVLQPRTNLILLLLLLA
jgi:NADPH:quinone reductase-like Zn-dependent oxidoreductase